MTQDMQGVDSYSGPHVKEADTDFGSNEHYYHVLHEVGLLVLDDLQKVLQVVLD